MALKIEFRPNVKLQLELAKVNKQTLYLYAELLAGEVDKYVPFRTGFLSQSAFKNGKRVPQNDDTDKAVFINYQAPYAARMYYGEGFNFSRNSHPLAKAYWGRETFQNEFLMNKLLKAAAGKVKK